MSQSQIDKLVRAMQASREVMRERLGSLYAPTITPLRTIMRQEMRRFGVAPIQAMQMHIGSGIDDLSMMLWLAAVAEEYAQQTEGEEPRKAVG